MKKLISVFFLFFTFVWTLVAAPPVPFSGKLAVDGKNFHGNALFAFSIVDGEGAVHWKHATENNATIENFVLNGRYLVLLGGQGMQTLPANLFLENDNLFLRVRVDLQDGQGIRLLEPDQPITSTPYALAAELARLAEKASVADGVTPGAITAGMIDAELLADLNKTITISDLPVEVVESMNRPITREMLPQDVRDDLNRTIGVAQLSAEVNEKLNRDFTIQPGSISKSLLGQDVLGDLNRTILRHHLSEELRAELNRTIRLRDLAPEVIADLNDSIAPGSITLDMLASGVRADLNRTVRLQDLSPEVSQSINRSITLSDLDSQVITELNNSIAPGSISLDQLSQQVRNDLNATITRERLSQNVRDELNATITRNRLSSDVLADLNRTVRLQDLSPEVSQSINRNITLSDLDSQVITELNNSIAPGSISLDQLSQQVRSDLNATITRDRLSQDLIADLNRTVRLQDLSPEVSQSINRSITLSDLDSQVITELNNSIATGSITLDLLSSQVRNDLNRTITKSMLSQEVLNELNSSSGGGGVVPGSLLAVPANQSAPSGYELYQKGEPKDLVWEEKAPVSVARDLSDGAEIIGDKIYLVGGWNGSGAKNIAERYDPTTNTWETLANMSAARQAVACAVLNGKLYAIGGVGLSSVEVFDPSTGSWSAGVALPSEVNSGTAITIAGKIYLFGGTDSSGNWRNQVLCFDPVVNQWVNKTPMPTARYGPKLVWYQNRLWVISFGNIVESYDPASDTWQTEASLTTQRNWPVAWTFYGRIYVAGGYNGTGHHLSSIEVYDPKSEAWTIFGNLPENKREADAVVFNNKVFIFAGNDGPSTYSNKVFAADLNASVSGVFDLYRKDGNASSGVPVAEVADGSVTASKMDPALLNELNSSSGGGGVVPGSLLAVPKNHSAPSGYSLYEEAEPKDLVWEEKAPVSVARFAYDGVEVLGGKIYFVGGGTGSSSSAQNIAERYDPGSNTWETLANMSAARAGVACAVLNGKLYAIGGTGLTSVEVFDPTTNNWSAGVALPSEVNRGTAIMVNGKIYLIGGWNASSQNLNQVLSFDPSTSQWSTKANMPTARNGAKLVWFENRIWAIGGYTGNITNKVESYDPSTDTWQAEASLTTGRLWPVAWVANGQIYVGGGQVASGVPINSIEVYDPATKQWTSAGNFPQNEYAADAVVLNDKAYVVAGNDGSGYSNKVFAADLNASVSGVFDLYRKDGNASSGVPTVQVEVADGSITTNQLNEQILKYLRPEVVRSPALPQNRERVYTGQSVTLSADAEGKYLTYQWLHNGQEISGATNKEFTISDANATLHDGNYSVRISNDFGHVSTTSVQLDVNDTQLIHEVDLNASVALEMIWVEPGTFTMGQDGVATPVHEVTLTKGFYLGKYEVTQAQYEAVMTGNTDSLSATPSNWPNNPDRPVEQVSWDDIQKFLTRLNSVQAGNIPEGWAYVLPTEAQWEYACRAGTTTAYSWGDSITTDNANYSGSGYSQTRDVGQYAANPWGFFDMHGNVWEWTADWYAAYSSGAQNDPEGPATGSSRVIRGGSWNYTGTYLRSAFHGSSNPSNRTSGLGFRVGFQQVPADVASPEMQILGDANITQLQGVAWVDPGVEAHDVRDGNLSGDVTVSGSVDVNTTGTYTLTYTVSDAAGNQATLTRTVNIVAGQASTHTADLNASVTLEMIWVEPGTFTMGQDGVATPVHEVTLTQGFYLGKYEVTQAQYEAVMTGNTDGLSATPSQWPNNPDRPVEKVSHDDIQKFLTRLNAQQAGNIPEGWAYVLPTEAQWEYACRAGTTTAYSWGATIASSNANYNWDGTYNSGADFKETRDVGQYSANPWGFFDMHGNVWEWTADWYAAYSSGAQTDPEGPATGSTRVYRGGSWGDAGAALRSARRFSVNPSNRDLSFGFRVGFQQQ